MLSFTEAAVTPAEAVAYFTARGVASWPTDEATQTTALRRGQDYIAREFNTRWASDWVDPDTDLVVVPDLVKYAIMESALVEAGNPGALSPVVKASDAKMLTGVDAITWTPIKGPTGVEAMRPRLLHVESMLAAVVRRPINYLLRA